MEKTQVAVSALDAQLLDLMLRAGSAWVLWLLLGLSFVAVAVILERALFFIMERTPTSALEAAMADVAKRAFSTAAGALKGRRSMQAAVARVCLENAEQGAKAVEEHAASVIDHERLRYERGLAFLGTLGNNAPFVGLFGTVLGIIRAFHDLSINSSEGASAVMAGIAEALVATGVGLLVALPAVAAFNFFSRHVESAMTGAEGLVHGILAQVHAREELARAGGPCVGDQGAKASRVSGISAGAAASESPAPEEVG